MTTLPVRTVSMISNCENIASAASTFGLSPVIITIIDTIAPTLEIPDDERERLRALGYLE